MPTGVAAADVSGALALWAVLRRRERSPLVIGCAVWGLVVIAWTVGEITVPH